MSVGPLRAERSNCQLPEASGFAVAALGVPPLPPCEVVLVLPLPEHPVRQEKHRSENGASLAALRARGYLEVSAR